ERLVGELAAALVDGDQAGRGQSLQHFAYSTGLGDRLELLQRDAAARVLRPLAGLCQPDGDRAGDSPPIGGERATGLGGWLRERAADPARSAVAVEGERACPTAMPRLEEGVLQERKHAGPPDDVREDRLDEAGLESEPDLLRRLLDHAPQPSLVERPEQNLA